MVLLQIAAGLVYANVTEWLVHKYVLHGLGKKKGSYWSFHWHEHHRASRKHDMLDESYFLPFWSGSRWKEILGIVALVAPHSFLFFYIPWFAAALYVYGAFYLWVHRRSHLDTSWCKKWLPWHRDHHLNKDQDQNWNVVFPLADWLLGTRKKD
jgi:hypothetical protein